MRTGLWTAVESTLFRGGIYLLSTLLSTTLAYICATRSTDPLIEVTDLMLRYNNAVQVVNFTIRYQMLF